MMEHRVEIFRGSKKEFLEKYDTFGDGIPERDDLVVFLENYHGFSLLFEVEDKDGVQSNHVIQIDDICLADLVFHFFK